MRTRAPRAARAASCNYDWFQVQGGDGFVAILDLRDSRIVYTESQDGNMPAQEQDHRREREHPPDAAERRSEPGRRRAAVPLPLGHADDLLAARSRRAARGREQACSSRPTAAIRGRSISPDLTTNADRDEIVDDGRERQRHPHRAQRRHLARGRTIVSLAESPKQAGVYYTGTDDGVVSVSTRRRQDLDEHHDELPGFPKGAWVSEVVPSRFDAGTVYITVDATG